MTAPVDFIVENMSQRMAKAVMEEVEEKGMTRAAEGKSAINAVIAAIRALESNGDITLITLEE